MSTDTTKQEQLRLPYQNIISDYQTLIGEEFNEDFLTVLENIPLDSETTDIEIASKTSMRAKDVRKILYKLYDSRILTYRRILDPNTRYTYFLWKLLPLKYSFTVFKQRASLKIKKLKERLEYERQHIFYHCGRNDCPKLAYKEAMQSDFKCPVCSRPLQLVNNEKTIELLRNKKIELEKDLETVSKKLS